MKSTIPVCISTHNGHHLRKSEIVFNIHQIILFWNIWFQTSLSSRRNFNSVHKKVVRIREKLQLKFFPFRLSQTNPQLILGAISFAWIERDVFQELNAIDLIASICYCSLSFRWTSRSKGDTEIQKQDVHHRDLRFDWTLVCFVTWFLFCFGSS